MPSTPSPRCAQSASASSSPSSPSSPSVVSAASAASAASAGSSPSGSPPSPCPGTPPAAVAFRPDQPAAEAHRALRRSLTAMAAARRCAVLWFADVMRRELYRELGHASINQYARQALGFSRTRTGDFVRLARKLEELPATRKAMASGELGYTKAREIVQVATPETEDQWLQTARGSREELTREVKKVKRAARVDPAQGELLPAAPTVAPVRSVPTTLRVELSAEQEARRAALVERLHRLGGVPTDRAELLLEALAALVEEKEGQREPGNARAAGSSRDGTAERRPAGSAVGSAAGSAEGSAAGSAAGSPGGPPGGPSPGARTWRPPVQIHVLQDGATGALGVPTDDGLRELSAAESARVRCDAAVSVPGRRNTTTIPQRVRRQVLERDGLRCQAPGCGRTRFLEIHHRVPRKRGGSNDPANLVTLCAACHQFWHEREAAGHAAGLPDAESQDAGSQDAGPPDEGGAAGLPDAGPQDAASPDARPQDAGSQDAASPGAGSPDLGGADHVREVALPWAAGSPAESAEVRMAGVTGIGGESRGWSGFLGPGHPPGIADGRVGRCGERASRPLRWWWGAGPGSGCASARPR